MHSLRMRGCVRVRCPEGLFHWVLAYKQAIGEPELPFFPVDEICPRHGPDYDPSCGPCGARLADADWEALLGPAGPLPGAGEPGWCPAHGGVRRCCGLWQAHDRQAQGPLLARALERHVHDAYNDGVRIVARCPVCGPKGV